MGLFGRKEAPSRRNSRKPGGRRNAPEKGVLSLWAEAFIFLFLVFCLYLLASLLSSRTGAWGAALRNSTLRNWGGSAVIPVLFGLYLSIAYFLKASPGRIIPQASGTFLLFLCASLLLGLLDMGGLFSGQGLFAPGYLGEGLAYAATRNAGTIGTVILAMAVLVMAATLYGFLHPATVIAQIFRFVAALCSDDWKRMPFPEMHGAAGAGNEAAPETSSPEFSSPIPAPGIPGEEEETSPGKYGELQPEDEFRIPGEEKDGEEESSLEEEEPVQEIFMPPALEPVTGNGEETTGPDPHALPEMEMPEEEEGKKILGGTFPPPLDLYGPRQQADTQENIEAVRGQSSAIIATLADFGVGAEMADVVIGPTVIQFQMQLAPGIKVSKVAGLSNDLAVALAVPSLRVEAPIPGKPYVGVEIPNPKRKGISLRTILESQAFQESENDLPLPMGVRVDSRPLVIGLEDLPHLLVAGTTGSGKSVFVTSCITGLCSRRTPEELRLILVDPKRVELSVYEYLPHVLAKPVVSPKKAIQALAWAVREMERRYEVFARARVRNLKSYNQCVLPKAKLPHIVIVVDELADLMFTAQKDVEDYICRLAQMARATGIHLILATQRPSVNVITGLIKANVPARVAFTLPSQTDSRTIIDVSGAERLLGKGDMLFVSSRYPRPLRVQSPFLDEGKSMEIVTYLRTVFGDPEYVDIEEQGGDSPSGGDTSYVDDPLLEEAVDIVLETGIASASRLQRQLRVGFTRAARLVDTMEQLGIVGPPEGSKPREILVDDESAREILSRSSSGKEV